MTPELRDFIHFLAGIAVQNYLQGIDPLKKPQKKPMRLRSLERPHRARQ